MRLRLNITAKIAALVLCIVLLTIAAISAISYQLSRRTLRDRYLHELDVLAAHKAQYLNSFLEETGQEVSATAAVLGNAVSGVFTDSTKTSLNEARLEQHLMALNSDFGFANFMVVNAEGRILYSLHNTGAGYQKGSLLDDPGARLVTGGKRGVTFSDVTWNGQQYVVMVAVPLADHYGNTRGILVGAASLENVFSHLQDTTGMGHTGETILSRISSNRILVQNPLRNSPNSALRLTMYTGDDANKAVQASVGKIEGYGEDMDYRGRRVLASWRPLSVDGWGLVVKIDENEIYQPVEQLKNFFVATAFIMVLFSTLLILLFTNLLVRPLIQLKEHIALLSKGVLPDSVPINTGDEIGLIAQSVNNFIQALRRTADFAIRIGEGDTNAEYKLLSEQDTLGQALVTMRDNLAASAGEDEHRNYIIRGEAEMGEILRRHTDLAPLGDDLLAYLVPQSGAIQGAFYLVEHNELDPNDVTISLRNSFAYNRRKYLKATFRLGEGLVGQAIQEKDQILRTEIPADYVSLSSGLLGDKKPGCILIVPLIANEQVNGAIELASLEPFTRQQIQFITELSHIIAQTLFNIQVNLRTRSLLEASQKMSYELQQQQEELRQNAEEMAATQEDLQHTNLRLAEQVEEVHRAQKRTQVLLENASEVIIIYEKDERIRYVSPSVAKILGYEAEELLATGLRSKTNPEHVEVIEQMFLSMVASPQQKFTVQFQVKNAHGEYIWMEATGNNQLRDPAINGLVLNMRDISERKQAEREARMRGQMQALSENSPDLIARISRQGQFFYINPVIELYTQQKPDDFQDKNIGAPLFDNHPFFGPWRNLHRQVLTEEAKLVQEVALPTAIGDRTMQVTALPELSDDEVESVLVVAHDITERKKIELEVQAKNKKITESINYAKRIQVSLLPDAALLQRDYPDSFILYKPRDVVSGDFPWIAKVGDYTYIAAADCTGHGVPGALISLIGHFLLKNVINSAESPAQILEVLDQEMSRTLRQDSNNAATRDGMDIGLVRIHSQKRVVEFAGAHRPLFLLRNNALEEVKGNRFPVGGGQHANREPFTNTTLPYEPGDSLLLFTDGYTDQFGGPRNSKFTPGRLRQLLTDHAQAPMADLHHQLETQFEDWKGTYKQTDDVLVIGVRLS